MISSFYFRPTPTYSAKVDEPDKDIKKPKRHSKKKSIVENMSSDKTIKRKLKSYKKRNETKEGFLLSLADDENDAEEKQVKKKKVKKEKKKSKDKERKFFYSIYYVYFTSNKGEKIIFTYYFRWREIKKIEFWV